MLPLDNRITAGCSLEVREFWSDPDLSDSTEPWQTLSSPILLSFIIPFSKNEMEFISHTFDKSPLAGLLLPHVSYMSGSTEFWLFTLLPSYPPTYQPASPVATWKYVGGTGPNLCAFVCVWMDFSPPAVTDHCTFKYSLYIWCSWEMLIM